MNANFNIPTVLIAPLDWGLGHATRCIPVIHALIANNFKVIVAAGGKQKKILQQEFPQLLFVELKGYEITYSKNKFFLPFKIAAQVPKILHAIQYEHAWLQTVIEQQQIDFVISDNRYGLYSTKLPSFFITHQLTIQTPFGFLTKLVQRINYKYINRFTQCWVPDFEGTQNIGGVLSHPEKLPSIPVHYLGALSRFQKNSTSNFTYKFCFLLSGPEPQRTLFENLILKDIHLLKSNCILLRGLPDCDDTIAVNENLAVHNHLSGTELNNVLNNSEYIVCRSGYTSIMELLALEKKAVLIATPGQTEQEFLAKHLMQQKLAYAIEQSNFNLLNMLEQVQQFNYSIQSLPTENLMQRIPQLVAAIQQ